MTLLFLILNIVGYAQQVFHVFPLNHYATPGTEFGNGSMQNPWDLQTAITQLPSAVNGGDTIWLHEGVYDGKFICTLQSTNAEKFVTISAYKSDTVILNGNVASNNKAVLEVKGQRVIFKNLEITFLGNYSRHVKDKEFQRTDGINHTSGEDCQFINLKIHDNPGSGFGSWKFTGGTTIYGCEIYNNGFFSEVRGRGAGIYVQNISDKTRSIINNTIFNNYYMGIEVWSAGKNAKNSFVKNMLLQDNVVFNNGSAGNHFKNNLIIATDDRNGVNCASNISVINNVFYHNINAAVNAKGDAGSVMLGRNKFSPLKNVTLKGNKIYGGNNALRIHVSDSLVFEDNVVYGGYVHLYKEAIHSMHTWKFNNNTYFSKNTRNFRIIDHKDFTFDTWRFAFNIDSGSAWKNLKQFQSEQVLQVNRNKYDDSDFNVVLMNVQGLDVDVDFSSYNIKEGSDYKIVDIENPNVVIKAGTLNSDAIVIFPMNMVHLERPKHNTFAQKTPSSFGVFRVKFNKDITTSNAPKTVFGRFFKWLGF
ncbi:hypothetical protein A9Q87_13675 [Flavobacteriales bacterium 34_180_T64]|nr:hypothetical protein A9Q87_13675 [Flavobacteriales bacterium 34_180_T64]